MKAKLYLLFSICAAMALSVVSASIVALNIATPLPLDGMWWPIGIVNLILGALSLFCLYVGAQLSFAMLRDRRHHLTGLD
jgi:hypothetical protein